MEKSSADVSELAKAATLKDYVSARAWVRTNKQFLDSQNSEEDNRNLLRSQIGKLVRAAALSGQVDNVEYFRCYAYLNEKGEETNQWTAFHCAVMGTTRCSQLSQSVKLSPTQDDRLQIIYMLHELGADVTIESVPGETPFVMALDPSINFKIGAVLLEILQKIQNKGIPSWTKDLPAPTYDECIQILVHWATIRGYTKLVIDILQDPCVSQELMGRCLKINSNESTLFHVVAEIGNDDLLKQLINISKISLEFVANCRCTYYLHGDSELGIDDQEISQTPVSIAIGKGNVTIFKAIHKLNENLCTLTCLNLSGVCITSVPQEILTFSTLKELDLSKNELVDLPLNVINEIKIEYLNLSQNKFTCIPDKLFDLPMIKSLNISSNYLAVVPMNTNWWRASTLQELNLSNNKITAIGMEPISDIDQRSETDTDVRRSNSVHTPAVSHVDSRLRQRTSSCSLVTDGANTSELSSLTVLRLKHNQLKFFPRGLACLTPKLESLYLANNKIEGLCSIKELPPKLQYLDISYNLITSNNQSVFQVASNPSYCLRVFNQLQAYKSCNHMTHEDLYNLEYLHCSHNELTQIYLFDESSQNLLLPKLISLDLSYNKFTDLPTGLYRCTELKYLHINNNPAVNHIPRDIGYIKHLSIFEYYDVADPLIETLNNISDISDKLTYLRSMQQSSEKNSMVNLMIVGPSGHGKSTLLSHLKSMDKTISQSVTFFDRPIGTAMQSHCCKEGLNPTVGIDMDCFVHNGIYFITWDFSGQEEYFSTHQFFITPGSVYAVCCQAKCLFESGVSMLLPWLAMIKAKAPGSPVLIICTFCDQLPNKTRKHCSRLRKCIMDQFSASDASISVEIKDVVFVKCLEKKQPCIANLQKKLHELVLTVKVPSTGQSRQNRQNLLDQLVPIAYLEFHKRLLAEAARIRRHLSTEQPVLTWTQLQELAYGICDEKELRGAVEHMKRNRMLIHFNIHGLQHVYFIDPQWLIDKLALIVSTSNISILSDFAGQHVQHPEIVDTVNLMQRLSDYTFLPTFQEIFCKLLFHFEVAIPINKSHMYFPSLMLTHSQFHYPKLSHSFPRNNDLQTTMNKLRAKYHVDTVDHSLTAPANIILESTGLCYRRFFVLTAVPGSIWHRLISRCLNDSKFIEIVKKNCCSSLQFQYMQNLGKTRVGNSVLEWIYWKNGVELRLSEMTLLQISNIDLTSCNKQPTKIPLHAKINNMYIHNGDEWLQISSAFTGGLEIVTPEHILMSVGDSSVPKISEKMSPQIFTHAIEVIDEIFMEWFSGTNTGNSIQAISEYLISFIPCPICVGDKKTHVNQADALTFSRMHMSYSTHSVQVHKSIQSTTPCSSASTHSSAKKSKKLIFGYDQSEIIVRANKFVFDDFNSAKQMIGENLVGFTMAHCLWVAQDHDYITCPKHGELKLQYLTPDLVYIDVKDCIISKKRLLPVSKQPIKQGGFGKVSKQILISEHDQSVVEATVAVKILANFCMLTPTTILEQYFDNRRELNIIYGLEHPSIVKLYGLTVHPVGFVMEWAGMGSLDDIIKQHQTQRQYICPDSVFAVTLQVIGGLQYLHMNNIVHFDIKPQNILIYKFPHESHCCYSNYTRETVNLRCIHCNKTGELDGVVIKIADFGISVRKGPRGFVRKIATPGHMAPEALLHRGKEHLSEKVDIFSLGICMYETMSCTMVPPKNQTIFEFEGQLKNGNRPNFSENVPRYPALLYDCMTSCWDQDPQIRPSAAQLLDTLCFTKLQLIDSFVFDDHKVTDVECCCKVSFEDNEKEVLWFAVNKQPSGSSILVIEFQVYENKVVPQVTQPLKLCFTEKVLKICQMQQFMYIVLEGVKIVTVHSQTHERLTMDCNLFNTMTGNPCATCCIQDMNLLLVAFTRGNIGILRPFPQNQFSSMEISSSFQYGIISSIERKCPQAQLCCLGIKGHFLCMEVITTDESTNDIWCGCNNNTIVVLSLTAEKTLVVSQTIKNASGSAKMSCKVLQLKMVKTLDLQLVCGLLDNGSIVCYDAGSKDCLNRISAYTATVMLPCNNKLYLGTKSGEILSLNINSIITDEATNEKPLVYGKHNIDQPVFDLLTVTGELSPHSFLEGFGSVHCKPNNKPCKVMLSIGGGYTEFFSCSEPVITVAPNDLCIISFRV